MSKRISTTDQIVRALVTFRKTISASIAGASQSKAPKRFCVSKLALVLAQVGCVTLMLTTPSAYAQNPSVPNVTQGAPGTLLKGPVDEKMGRTPILEYLGGYIISIPEVPGSESGDHMTTKAWNLSDPRNPQAVAPRNPNANGGHFGRTGHPFLAHGSIRRDNEVYISSSSQNSGNRLDAVRLNDDGSLEHVQWSGRSGPALIDRNGEPVVRNGNRQYASWWTKGSMMRPWAMQDNWAYNTQDNVTRLTLDNRLMAEWDITADSGVSGFGNFMGNLLIYASDQRRSGVAAYDATDIYFDNSTNEWKPRLLDTLNVPAAQGGIGGYWSEISGHRLVIARGKQSQINENFFAGIQVVDFSDPTDLKLTCNLEFKEPLENSHWTLGGRPQYVGLQDEFAFVDYYKVNIETCEVVLKLDRTQGQTSDLCYHSGTCPKIMMDTSQYSRVIGNLWLTGGYPTLPGVDGYGIWVHQSAPDRRAPYISYHIPQANQTNYPVNAPLSFSIPETLRSTSVVTTATAEPGEARTVTLTEVGGDEVNLDYVLSHAGMLTVEPLGGLKPDTTYEVAFTSGIQDAVGNAMQPYSFQFATGNSINNPAPTPPEIDRVTVTPGNNVLVGDPVTISVSASTATEYEILLDSESTRWRSDSTRTVTFSQTGTVPINVRVRNSNGVSAVQRLTITVTEPVRSPPPGHHTSQLSCHSDSETVWAVNPDNNSVAVLNAASMDTVNEITGIKGPQGLTRVGDAEIWVTATAEDRVYVIDINSFSIKRRFSTGYGSAPTQILASPDNSTVYISLYGSGEVVRYSASTGEQLGARIALAPTVKAMALSADGSRLLVARFISNGNYAAVFDINATNWTRRNTFFLHKHLVDDDLDEGRGLPNYLSGIVINGQGNRAYVVAKKDNVDRGLLQGLDQDLDDDNMVRTLVATLDLQRGYELRAERVDLDNTSSLSAVTLSNDNTTLFVAMQGKNSVAAMPINGEQRFTGQVNEFATGLAPQGLCTDPQRSKLFTKNFTDRSVTALDLSQGLVSPAKSTGSTVSNEKLSAEELAGLQVFYNAFNGLSNSTAAGKMSAEGYVSCASCHIDGGEDGNTYDLTGRGEGLRNTLSLNGRSGTRFGDLHWSANFDEVQDFEHDIRDVFKGTGFLNATQFAGANTPLGASKAGLSTELDNLAAYVASLGKASLPRSPYRNSSGGMTSDGQAGRALFTSQGCVQCHSGSALTDKQRHNVGTQRSHSGGRLGEALDGIKTPSLLGTFATPPYLHDGSAATLNEVFSTTGGRVIQAENGWQWQGTVITQRGYSYLRDASAMRLSGDGAIWGHWIDGGSSGGTFKLRVRYGSAQGSQTSGGQLSVKVGESNAPVQHTFNLRPQPRIEGQDVVFTETESVDIQVPAGGQNVRLEYTGTSVVIDEITVSDPQTLTAATPHTKVQQLNAAQRRQLLAYLLQIDQQSAPADSETDIFGNDTDNDPAPVITLSPASVDETAGRAVVTAKLATSQSEAVTFVAHTRPGTAVNGVDYYGMSNTFEIPAGDLQVSIPVEIIDDDESEDQEYFNVRVNSVNGERVSGVQTQVQILANNNDTTTTLSINSGAVNEGEEHQATVTLSQASADPVQVSVATGTGTATQGADYYGLSGTITFDAGQTSKTFAIKTLDDSAKESDEIIPLRLYNAQGARIKQGNGQLRIVDND